MKKNILILFIAISVTFSACKNENIEKPIQVDRAEIKKNASLHSKGLAYLKNSKVSTKNTPIPTTPGTGAPTPVLEAIAEINTGLDQFALDNNLSNYLYLKNSVPGFNTQNLPTVSLSQNGLAYSQQFYILANEIIGMQGSSYQDIDNQIDNIATSTSFQNLTAIEQTILLTSAEILLDSYAYWSSEYGLGSGVATKGFWNKLWKVVKRDALGALGGGLAGGALTQSIVGAGAGALFGAVTHSAYGDLIYGTVDEPLMITENETILVNGILIPKELDVVVTESLLVPGPNPNP